MLSITGKANDALRDWEDIKDRNILADNLTTKFAVPVRHPKEYTNKETFLMGSKFLNSHTKKFGWQRNAYWKICVKL